MRAVQTAIPVVMWPIGVLIVAGLLVHSLVRCVVPRPADVDDQPFVDCVFPVDEPSAPVVPSRSHRDEEAQLERHGSKSDGTARKLDRYAREAQPAWELEHPGRECPSSVDELNRYIGASDSLDLWGHPIAILCRTTTPRGLSAFSVMSAGEDGQLGTDDDLAPF